jgi:hypothetical protein
MTHAINQQVYLEEPIQAGLAPTPEQSDFTSIQQRLKALSKAEADTAKQTQPDNLSPFTCYQPHSKKQIGLPFRLLD